ncbi:MAG: serine/threonine protein kinase [Infirmifilum sp.]
MSAEIFEWSRIITYPFYSWEDFVSRAVELQLLGVKRLFQEGKVEVFGKRVLGKGTVGIVVKAQFVDGTLVSVKIRRSDASRSSLLHEARILLKVNSVGVGPRLVAYSRNYLIWRFVNGVPIEAWITKCSSQELRQTLKLILEQLWILDQIGIAHNELSRFKEHVLVQNDGKPVIIDFESSTENKYRTNIPQFLGFLLNERSLTSKITREKLSIEVARDKLITILRSYKRGIATIKDILTLIE